MPFVIPFWLKIVGPMVILALVVGGIAAWGHSKYNAGHKAGVEQVDAQWDAATKKLEEQARQSATRADDAAAKRTEEFRQQAEDDRKAVDDAKAKGSSPIDALFGDGDGS